MPGLLAAMGLGGCSEAAAPPLEPTPEVGAPVELQIEATEVLRRLSFDLRGTPPTDEEYAEVLAAGEVSAEMIDSFLESDSFLDRVEDWHAEVLWPNISRYRITAASLAAVRPIPITHADDVGVAVNGADIGADPALIDDEEERARWVLSFESEATGTTLRGGRHARPTHYCDMTPEAEYPPEDAVGTAANRYTVTAERTGDGSSYEATYYSEDPEHYGMVMPIQDWQHCPNYCFLTSCGDPHAIGHRDADGDGNNDCFHDMDAPGDDPAGRHRFDTPGMRCPSGYERMINSCDYAQEFADGPRGLKPQREGRHGSSFNPMRDGWRWQTHYWSRGVAIRTCALEAQQREFGVVHTGSDGSPLHCGDVRHYSGWGIDDPSCGCGPQGVYCQPSQAEYNTEDETRTEFRLRSAIEREPLRIIRSVIERDEDYFSALTTRRSFVNGPLALAWSQQARTLQGEGGIGVTAPADDLAAWESIDYESEEWAEYERSERNAGILTTLEFLLRFPTARSRISQFRRVFACSTEFDYAPQPDPNDDNPDIASRSGCSSCHARLETDGMWFGRYPDRNGIFLDPAAFPVVNEACRYCVVGDGTDRRSSMWRCEVGRDNPFVPGGVVSDPDLLSTCRDFYANWSSFDDTQADSAGHLWAAAYRDPSLTERVDAGPRGMVEAELERPENMLGCVATRAFERLVRRSPGEAELAALVAAFEGEGRSYRALVRAVLMSDAYRGFYEGEESP